MKIELIHPPHLESIEDKLDAPLGLLYIASNLELNGFEVSVNDLSGLKPKQWKINEADVYGISMYAPTMKTSEQIALKCKETNPKSKIITGGAHPTAIPKQISNIFDSVCIGEGEEAMLDFLKDYPNVKRYYNHPLQKNLDKYPNPAYHLVNLSDYKRKIGGEPAITLLTSSGCPYRCSFCGLPEHHKKIKTRSVERVVEEIKQIKEKYGIKKINFQDDTFMTYKKRAHRLLEKLEPLELGFKVHGRSGLDTKEDYRILKKAGCEVVAWGIESGSQKMLDLMNKNTTVQNNENVIRWAKESGLETRAFFVFGFPQENKKTIQETKKFIERTNPDQYFVSNFVPYPNTDVWKNPEKYGVTHIDKNFKNYFQVDKTGYGSRNIEVNNLTQKEFFKLEKDFREWIKQREIRGSLQDYESILKKNS